MPFPPHAFTIHGGCNCGAVRYEVSVPPQAERPMAPYRSPGVSIDATIPSTLIDHCGDCRRATSAVFNTWMITLVDTVRLSVQRPKADGEAMEEGGGKWLSARQVLVEDSLAGAGTTLSHYRSSVKARRWFCNRCGTPLFYSLAKAYTDRLGSLPMLDILLGSVDTEDLQHDWMKPIGILWCQKGIPWMRELTFKGADDLPAGPLWKLDQSMDDDIEADLKTLSGLSEWNKRP